MNINTEVLKLIGVDREGYLVLLFENGIQYLRQYASQHFSSTEMHELVIKDFSNCKSFWQWYKQIYTQMDKAFLVQTERKKKRMTTNQLLSVYNQLHVNVRLYPHKRIINEVYKNEKKRKTRA